MSNVKVLAVESLAPNQEVVEKLEELLAEARAGKIRGLTILTNEPQSRQTGCTKVGEWSRPLALWAAEIFKHRLLHEIQENL